jgi:hypothetical protein
VVWYEAHQSQKEDGFIIGHAHGTVIETEYNDQHDPVIKKLKEICKENCTSSWSIGHFPAKYKGITFRFFNKHDINIFNTALEQLNEKTQ